MKLHPEYARRLAGQQELLNRPNREIGRAHV